MMRSVSGCARNDASGCASRSSERAAPWRANGEPAKAEPVVDGLRSDFCASISRRASSSPPRAARGPRSPRPSGSSAGPSQLAGVDVEVEVGLGDRLARRPRVRTRRPRRPRCRYLVTSSRISCGLVGEQVALDALLLDDRRDSAFISRQSFGQLLDEDGRPIPGCSVSQSALAKRISSLTFSSRPGRTWNLSPPSSSSRFLLARSTMVALIVPFISAMMRFSEPGT